MRIKGMVVVAIPLTALIAVTSASLALQYNERQERSVALTASALTTSAQQVLSDAVNAEGGKVDRAMVVLDRPIKTLGLHPVPIHLHPEVESKVTVNVARSPEQAERQAKGEDLSVREQTSMDDLGLEVGRALAEAGPNASFEQ